MPIAARRWSALLLGGSMLLLPSCLAKRSSSGDGGGGAGGEPGEGGEGGSGASASLGLSAARCEACMAEQVGLEDPCEIALMQCQDDPACSRWLDCYGECTLVDWSADCLDGCDAAEPTGTSLVYGLVSCTCAECAAEPHCAPVCR